MSFYGRFYTGEADVSVVVDLDNHPAGDLPGTAGITLVAARLRAPWEDDLEINITDGSIVDAVTWEVQFTFSAAHLATAGRYMGEVTVTDGTEAYQFPVSLDVLAVRGDVDLLSS